jgi:hypothetical protein
MFLHPAMMIDFFRITTGRWTLLMPKFGGKSLRLYSQTRCPGPEDSQLDFCWVLDVVEDTIDNSNTVFIVY